MKNNNFPIMGIMFLILMTLKLCEVIDWSWWWVTAPLWGTIVVAFIGAFIISLVKAFKR